MKHNLAQSMKWYGLSEGGYVNHKKDPGGATDRGVTQRTYNAWLKSQGRAQRSVKGISKAEAEAIFEAQYLAPIRFNLLPDGLDYAMGDYAINSGPAKATKDLQRILGVSADGIMGTITLEAINQFDTIDLIIKLCEGRMRFLRGLDHWPTFKNGWTARVMGAKPGVQHGDIGVIDRAVRMAKKRDKIPDPLPHEDAKAPPPAEPDTVAEDSASKGALVGIGGAVAASGGVLSALGDLDPTAQMIAIGGLLVALAAMAWVFRARIKSMAT